jgi:hypothetical protein
MYFAVFVDLKVENCPRKGSILTIAERRPAAARGRCVTPTWKLLFKLQLCKPLHCLAVHARQLHGFADAANLAAHQSTDTALLIRLT